MNKLFLFCMLALGIPTHALTVQSSESVIQYAETQLHEAFRILLSLTNLESSSDTMDPVTRRIIDVVTERQTIRLLRAYPNMTQQRHFQILRKIYETQSPHPLLTKALILQANRHP